MAKRLTDRLTCNRIFIEEAHRQGLTVEAIIGEVKRGMTEAMHPQHPDQPDNFNRRSYTDMAVKIYGGYAPSKFDIRKQSLQARYELTEEDLKRLEGAFEEDDSSNDKGETMPSDNDDDDCPF